MKKYPLFVFIQLILAIIFSTSVYSVAISEIDVFNDVYYQMITDNQTITKENQIRPEIDIFKVLYHIDKDANTIEISVAVNGSIQDKESISYIVWYNTTNESYCLKYSNGKNLGWATNFDTNESFYEINPLQITLHTITTTYNLINENSKTIDLWGYAYEININESETHLWFDYVPNYHSPPNIIHAFNQDYNNQTIPDGSETDGGTTSTPGFEIFLIIIAFIVIIATKRKKDFS